MLLLIQFLIVTVLILVLVCLYIEERRGRYGDTPLGKMTAFWDGKERRRDVRIPKTLNVKYIIEKNLVL